MKIKMITLEAGPEGIKQPGGIYDVDPKEGKTLVDGGYAEAVDEPKEEPKGKQTGKKKPGE